MQQIERAVRDRDQRAALARFLAQRLRLGEGADHRRPRDAARGATTSVGCATSTRASSVLSSWAEAGTVPGFCTLRAPATLAIRIACTGAPPAAPAAVAAAHTRPPRAGHAPATPRP